MNEFGTKVKFPHLRMLDVSCNNLTSLSFTKNMPQLRHLFAAGNKVKNFKEIFISSELETLSISNNLIVSFEGFPNLTEENSNLKVITAIGNKLETLEHLGPIPFLMNLDLTDNPISNYTSTDILQQLLSSVLKLRLPSNTEDESEIILPLINGVKIKKENIKYAQSESGKLYICAKLGFVPPKGPLTTSDYNLFLENRKIEREICPIILQRMALRGTAQEGSKLIFTPIFKMRKSIKLGLEKLFDLDLGMFEMMKNFTFHTFQVSCKSENVCLLIDGRIIEMEDDINDENENNENNDKKSHSVSLMLVPGNYTYRYSFNGKAEKQSRTVSIQELETKQENQKKKYFFQVKWFYNEEEVEQSKELNENSQIYYSLKKKDVGKSLRCEFSIFSNETSSLIQTFTIFSDVIQPNIPSIKNLRISKKKKLVEGDKVTILYEYNGGKEGKTLIKVNGKENNNSKEYIIKNDDVGKPLSVEVTPIREDGVAGNETKIVSEVSVEAIGRPTIKNLTLKKLFVSTPQGTSIEKEKDEIKEKEIYYVGDTVGVEMEVLGTSETPKITWKRMKQFENTGEVITSREGKKEITFDVSDFECVITVEVSLPGNDGLTTTETVSTTPIKRRNDKTPAIKSINVSCGMWRVGKTAMLEIEYEDSDLQGDGRIFWMRIKDPSKTKDIIPYVSKFSKKKGEINEESDDKDWKIVHIDSLVYKFTQDDVGYQVGCVFSPVNGSSILVFDPLTHQKIVND